MIDARVKNKVHFQDIGAMPYQEAWDLQESLLKVNAGLKLAARPIKDPHRVNTQHHLLFCEHPHVFTLGKSGNIDHLLLQEDLLKSKGIEFYKTNRGGDITYHGPGQITGYPIFDLEKFKTDLHWYLRSMEEVMIRVLADYGLEGGRIDKATGVWLGVGTMRPRKICAFGVKASRWITMHGFAFNVATDLSFFQHIVPCGISDKGVTSLNAELKTEISLEEVKGKLKQYFSEVFQFDYV